MKYFTAVTKLYVLHRGTVENHCFNAADSGSILGRVAIVNKNISPWDLEGWCSWFSIVSSFPNIEGLYPKFRRSAYDVLLIVMGELNLAHTPLCISSHIHHSYITAQYNTYTYSHSRVTYPSMWPTEVVHRLKTGLRRASICYIAGPKSLLRNRGRQYIHIRSHNNTKETKIKFITLLF
jgi:hypothetical protein